MTNTTLTNGTNTVTFSYEDVGLVRMTNSLGEMLQMSTAEARSRMATLRAAGWKG